MSNNANEYQKPVYFLVEEFHQFVQDQIEITVKETGYARMWCEPTDEEFVALFDDFCQENDLSPANIEALRPIVIEPMADRVKKAEDASYKDMIAKGLYIE